MIQIGDITLDFGRPATQAGLAGWRRRLIVILLLILAASAARRAARSAAR
jgi:hypothetical protein